MVVLDIMEAGDNMKIAFLDTIGLTYNGDTLNEKGYAIVTGKQIGRAHV